MIARCCGILYSRVRSYSISMVSCGARCPIGQCDTFLMILNLKDDSLQNSLSWMKYLSKKEKKDFLNSVLGRLINNILLKIVYIY